MQTLIPLLLAAEDEDCKFFITNGSVRRCANGKCYQGKDGGHCLCDQGYVGNVCHRRANGKKDPGALSSISELGGKRFVNQRNTEASILGRQTSESVDECKEKCQLAGKGCKSANFGKDGERNVCEMVTIGVDVDSGSTLAAWVVDAPGWTFLSGFNNENGPRQPQEEKPELDLEGQADIAEEPPAQEPSAEEPADDKSKEKEEKGDDQPAEKEKPAPETTSAGPTTPAPPSGEDCRNLKTRSRKVRKYCYNGKCFTGEDGGHCLCSYGYSGDRCNAISYGKEDASALSSVSITNNKRFVNAVNYEASVTGRQAAGSAVECKAACQKAGKACRSANYGTDGGTKVCEFLGLTAEPGSNAESLLVDQSGWSYICCFDNENIPPPQDEGDIRIPVLLPGDDVPV